MSNQDILILVVAIVVLVAVAVAAIALTRRANQRHHAELRQRFGSEYDRARDQYGRRTDRALDERLEHVQKLRLRDLDDAERQRFDTEWTTVQAMFVDDPRGAASRANELVKDVMRARGYPPGDPFERRVADLSVDHPDVVQHYRAAHALAKAGDDSSTEDLRQAVVHYRVIFADLLAPSTPSPTPALRPRPA